jgi:hypothetical protein
MSVAIRADKYFNNKAKYDMYSDVIPVDMNAGLIHEKADKYASDPGCLAVIEDNIQERFGLEEPNED